jgi:hypothetical protein
MLARYWPKCSGESGFGLVEPKAVSAQIGIQFISAGANLTLPTTKAAAATHAGYVASCSGRPVDPK